MCEKTKPDTRSLLDVEAYSYDLPEELVAQNPAERRDASRLMYLAGGAGIGHRIFSDLPKLLIPGDILVMNDTRVLKARLLGRKIPGGASAEIFCLSQIEEAAEWRAMVRPGRKLPPGSRVELEGGCIVEIGERLPGGLRAVRLPNDVTPEAFFERCGTVPLPPYIGRSTAEAERYQTVYSKKNKAASVAAPTAGLHFTPGLLDELARRGIESEFITLDVGIGTFRPVRESNVRSHVMHSERCCVGCGQAARINAARAGGRRIVAVGTTAVRTLESFALPDGTLECGERNTDIFIVPGYKFKAVDALITNFHLPRSTLLMLVAAFAGYERTMAAYAEAVRERYRFFSFGDAMLLERPEAHG